MTPPFLADLQGWSFIGGIVGLLPQEECGVSVEPVAQADYSMWYRAAQ